MRAVCEPLAGFYYIKTSVNLPLMSTVVKMQNVPRIMSGYNIREFCPLYGVPEKVSAQAGHNGFLSLLWILWLL